MPNVMAALPNKGGALCSTPQWLIVLRFFVPLDIKQVISYMFFLANLLA